MADIQPVIQQPMSDDQELAKVLAGVSAQADDATDVPVDQSTLPTPIEEPVAVFTPPEPISVAPAADDLAGIKKDAIVELRPLVDKLELAPEEKFDTYLLLLRSTDDKELIAPAHEAAKNIPDEARRAQALLDIIKEIDYLSGQSQQPA